MRKVEGNISTYDTEKAIFYADRGSLTTDDLRKKLSELGDKLIAAEMLSQSLTMAVDTILTREDAAVVTNLAGACMDQYLNRYTTVEMRKKLEALEFPNLYYVIVGTNYANEAIEYGMDVYAVANGCYWLLERHNEATKYAASGCLFVVSPFTYEYGVKNGFYA